MGVKAGIGQRWQLQGVECLPESFSAGKNPPKGEIFKGSMLKEFKAFAMRGNVLDLAIAVIIGAAFGKIVTSFVNDVLMPPVGMLMGKVDFKTLFISLDGNDYANIAAAQLAKAPIIAYGNFIQTIVDFVIVAFVIFLMVRQINRFLTPQGPPPAVVTKECPQCLSVIPLKAVRCSHCTSPV